MLLLQLDMLACVSEFEAAPVLVIGAGVPASWLEHPSMSVRGLPTSVGTVNWSYRDGKLLVEIAGPQKCRVRTGIGFGKNTKMEVKWLAAAG